MLSGAINSNSKILYDREPLARVAKALAPFLTLDGTPYPVVANGNIPAGWLIDGYTTTDLYPYSTAAEHARGHEHQPNCRHGNVAGQLARPGRSTTSFATRSRQW